jgi:glucosamine--fructose-6-phosphate aminotransferase (isomerizing)
MCGIVAVVRRRGSRAVPDVVELTAQLDAAVARLGPTLESMEPADVVRAMHDAAAAVEGVDRQLRGTAGLRALLAAGPGGHEKGGPVDDLERCVGQLEAGIVRIERFLDAQGARFGNHVEAVNASLEQLKDAVWAVRHDRLRAARAVAQMTGPDPSIAAVEACASIQIVLSALDRLEVRGRDSAGVHVTVEGHGLDLAAPDVHAQLSERTSDRLFRANAVRVSDGHLCFVYKAAAEIGELGDNTRAIRRAIVADDLLRLALRGDDAQATVLAHTRWASVGIISEANAHPVNQEEDGREGPYVVAALNGDVDNYAQLRDAAGLRLPPEFTTDAKVIPALVSRRVAEEPDLGEAFRSTVASFDGSVAIAAASTHAPGQVLLALRGSGQALYIGLAEDAYVVASEPYGVVEETSTYLRMDGETSPGASAPGQIVVLDRAGAGTIDGIRRFAYDGTPRPVRDTDLSTATITTRDIDRGEFPHFLLKELSEAPQSFRKTLRGRIEEHNGTLAIALGPEALPDVIVERLRNRTIKRVIVIGQGTAAVAGQAIAAAIDGEVGAARLLVGALPATELSGFSLDDDMADALVVAVSQSGTTTDTNRTVDLVRARGASVIGIVNRRNSDLVEKAHGVLYTSDGRDVEMSVASTKAFYAQIAAGYLLALAIAAALGPENRAAHHELLAALRDLPTAMDQVLARRDEIADAAQRHAPGRRYWAVVGNGPNRVAAQEIRIKLSELCYKSIACDTTEDKKHIDLSSEPLILVCAAGLEGPNADDVGKEVAIYRAHRAAPVVIATDGQQAFTAALQTLRVPRTHPRLAFVLSAMVGHLFGYEAALAIDGQARILREARAAIEASVAAGFDGDRVLEQLAPALEPLTSRFLDELRAGSYNGHLEASTAVRVASLLRYATAIAPLEAYAVDSGKVGTPSALIEDLTEALTRAIEELTRPIDAIKHQAKTVTVGISRSEDALFEASLVREVLTIGVARDRLSYRVLRTLAGLDPSVAEVTGFTRYRIEGNLAEGVANDGAATLHVVDKGGIAADLASRTERDPRLRGTKHTVASDHEVMVARGRNDGRTVMIVPESKDTHVTGLALLHVRFHDRLTAVDARSVLKAYRNRYAALRDTVTETEPSFDEDTLATLPVVDLLTAPVHSLADHWRA